MPGSARPFVHLNLAVTREGRLHAAEGGRLAISCDADWRRVHRLRETYDAVAVGAVTWHADAPRLDARRERLGREPLRQPDRVIFSGSRDCVVVAPDSRRTFVIGALAPQAAADRRGAAPIFIPSRGHLLRPPLLALHRQRVRSLLVEGGPRLLRSFLRQRCFDLVTAYVAADSIEAAQRAARAALPELPELHAARFGGGVLLTSAPAVPRAAAPAHAAAPAPAE